MWTCLHRHQGLWPCRSLANKAKLHQKPFATAALPCPWNKEPAPARLPRPQALVWVSAELPWCWSTASRFTLSFSVVKLYSLRCVASHALQEPQCLRYSRGGRGGGGGQWFPAEHNTYTTSWVGTQLIRPSTSVHVCPGLEHGKSLHAETNTIGSQNPPWPQKGVGEERRRKHHPFSDSDWFFPMFIYLALPWYVSIYKILKN